MCLSFSNKVDLDMRQSCNSDIKKCFAYGYISNEAIR